jgi:vacuolar-type H+-ATPase subunit I/STV1
VTTETPSAGTQLRIAARGKAEPQDASPAAMVASILDEIRKQHREWRGTLGQLRGMLDSADHAFSSIVETQEAEVGRLVQVLSERAEDVAQRIRAEAAIEIAQLQAVVERHEVDLESAREALRSATEQVAAERSGRRQAEQERDEAGANLADLTQQLEGVRAERARLANALTTIREAVSQAPAADDAWDEAERAVSRLQEPMAEYAPEVTLYESSAVEEAVPSAPVDPELADHVKRLLDQAKVMYLADMKSGAPPVEVVDRLTSLLRYSRDLLLLRSPDNATAAVDAFNAGVTLLLDAEAASTFGRHLSIAAFAARTHDDASAG